MDLALVHKLQQGGHVVRRGRLQYDDTLAICGRVLEQIGELLWAGRQYKFVGFEYCAWNKGGNSREMWGFFFYNLNKVLGSNSGFATLFLSPLKASLSPASPQPSTLPTGGGDRMLTETLNS